MRYLSEDLDVGTDFLYSRGELCELLGLKYRTVENDIEKGIFKPANFASVLIFSTLENQWGYYNRKLDEITYIYTGAYPHSDDINLILHQIRHTEALLFIRKDQETGFYYYGRVEYQGKFQMDRYYYPLYKLKLIDTTLSCYKNFQLPLCEKTLHPLIEKEN